MGAFNSLEQNIITRLGVAGSEDRLPYVVVDGANESDGLVITSKLNTTTDITLKIIDSTPTSNETLGVTVVSDDIVITLGTENGVQAVASQILTSGGEVGGTLDLTADNTGTAGNSLKVIIAQGTVLLASMGGTGNNTLTITLATGGSTVANIETAVNAIVTNKKITALAGGVTTKKIVGPGDLIASPGAAFTTGANSTLIGDTAADIITLLEAESDFTDIATVALYTGDAENLEAESVNDGAGLMAAFPLTATTNPSLNGAGVDTAGFSEAMVLLTIGTISPAGALDVKIQDSADNITFDDVDGAAFATKTDLDSNTIDTARLKLDGNSVRRYIKVVSTLDPDDQVEFAEHSVVFLFGAEQYCPQTETPIAFVV